MHIHFTSDTLKNHMLFIKTRAVEHTKKIIHTPQQQNTN